MLIQSASKLTGSPGITGWAQVHEFTPDDPEKLKLRGHLFAIVSTSHTEEGIDTITAGRELLTRYHEEYYGNLDGKPFNVLRDTTQKVADEFRRNWGDVEIVAATFIGDVVYSTAVGGAGVMILRNGALGKILESEKEQVISASGFPQVGDVVLLATKTFFENVPFGVIKAALSAPTPEDSVETFGPIVLGEQGLGNLGAAVIKFEEKPDAEPIFSQEPVKFNISPKIKFGFVEKIQKTIGNFFKRIPQRNIYIRTESVEEVSPQSKKLTFTIAAILLFLLAVSIGFGIRQKNINDTKNKYQGILRQAQDEVDQAISLASVSGERSRELFTASQQKLKQIESLNVSDPEIAALKKKIDESRAAILGEYQGTPQMFLDLTLLSSGFNGDSISFSGGTIYILDKSGQRIISVDVSTKKSKVVAGPGVINSAVALAAYEEKVFVLTTDGIYEVDSGNSKVIEKTWSGDALISAFAGNMYVMDKNGGAIYRFQGQNNTFGDKQNWLAAGTSVNFADVVQMTIDGSIYALYPNSKVLKFSQGSPQNFNVKGAFPEIGNINAIYASPDNQYLYLLDKAGGRVIVTDKKGAYKAQYVDPQISTATKLVVSEADKKIVLLTGDKLYSIEIK
jgi:sugar lactone lactonase YvrE